MVDKSGLVDRVKRASVRVESAQAARGIDERTMGNEYLRKRQGP